MNNKRGFSFIEVIIVVTIIAIAYVQFVPKSTKTIEVAEENIQDINMIAMYNAAKTIDSTEVENNIETGGIANPAFMAQFGEYTNLTNEELSQYNIFKLDKEIIIQYTDNNGVKHSYPK